jgi:hypothetical protein
MQTFDEGNIRLAFPTTWVVLKYDDSLYYRGPVIRTGAGLAAVDFVAVRTTAPSALLLLEVKDFRGYATENRPRLASGDLATEVAKKALDSFGALHIGLRANQQELRDLAPALIPYSTSVHVVLLLEEDEPPRIGASGHLSNANKWKRATALKLRGEVLDLLQGKLKPFRITAALHSCTDVPANAGWSASTS